MDEELSEEGQKQFDIFAVVRIIDRAYDQYDGDALVVQEVIKKRLASMGLVIDLEETIRQHMAKDFHEEADIIAVADDGFRFIRYNGCWVVGTDQTQYLVLRVKPDCIEVLRKDGISTVNQ